VQHFPSFLDMALELSDPLHYQQLMSVAQAQNLCDDLFDPCAGQSD
jgi:hypothetical protein